MQIQHPVPSDAESLQNNAMTHWAKFYHTGKISDYLQYRNSAQREEQQNAPDSQRSGSEGDTLW